MILRGITLGIVLAILLSGCSRTAGLRCENQERYSDAGEVAPLRIPDNLDPPSESESLHIPTDVAAMGTGNSAASDGNANSASADSCTEAPPDFFEAGVPG